MAASNSISIRSPRTTVTASTKPPDATHGYAS